MQSPMPRPNRLRLNTCNHHTPRDHVGEVVVHVVVSGDEHDRVEELETAFKELRHLGVGALR